MRGNLYRKPFITGRQQLKRTSRFRDDGNFEMDFTYRNLNVC